MKLNKIIALTSVFALSFSVTSVAFAATANELQNVTLTVTENLTFACGDAAMGSVVADGATIANGTTTCAVTTNDVDGYHLQIQETQLLTHTDSVATISDITPVWDGSNAAQYPTTGLAFRVSDNSTGAMDTAEWGASVLCGNDSATELYAGLPTLGAVDILEEDNYNAGISTTTICYAAAVPTTQQEGAYTANVTYTVNTGA